MNPQTAHSPSPFHGLILNEGHSYGNWGLSRTTTPAVYAEPIVIGSRGLGRAQSALLGSVSSAVIAHAKRTVLVGPTHVAPGGAGPVRSE